MNRGEREGVLEVSSRPHKRRDYFTPRGEGAFWLESCRVWRRLLSMEPYPPAHSEYGGVGRRRDLNMHSWRDAMRKVRARRVER